MTRRVVTFRPKTEFAIRVVPDEYGACPRCGAYWGHPDPKLDFPNRQKVDNAWRCYNPDCTAGYYNPDSNRVLEDKVSAERELEIRAEAARRVEEMMVGRIWITRDIGPGASESRLHPENEPIPPGYHR